MTLETSNPKCNSNDEIQCKFESGNGSSSLFTIIEKKIAGFHGANVGNLKNQSFHSLLNIN